jgi:hypothetical protein
LILAWVISCVSLNDRFLAFRMTGQGTLLALGNVSNPAF